MSGTIGIIANPSSGKDIRRLVAYGGMTTNAEKINILRRIILGLVHAGGIENVFYMPDYIKLVEEAVAGINGEEKERLERSGISIQPLEMPMYGLEEDSIMAAALLREKDVSCVIVLGGDGTSRAVAKEIGNVPLIAISTGTNNVFPIHLEGTIAGWAAGLLASGKQEYLQALIPSKRLEIMNEDGSLRDIALVDAVTLEEQHLGSRAMWQTDEFDQVFLTMCSPVSIGISSIGGRFTTISREDPAGLALDVGPGVNVEAPIVPGIFRAVDLSGCYSMEIGKEYAIRKTPCVIAVDGERSIHVEEGANVSVKVTWNGPRLVDTRKILEIERKNSEEWNKIGSGH